MEINVFWGFQASKSPNVCELKLTETDGVTLHTNVNSILVLFVLPAV